MQVGGSADTRNKSVSQYTLGIKKKNSSEINTVTHFFFSLCGRINMYSYLSHCNHIVKRKIHCFIAQKDAMGNASVIRLDVLE